MYGVRWGKRRRQHQSLTYHAQIPLSPKLEIESIEQQIRDLTVAIALAKNEKQESFTIKQMEKTRKSLKRRIKKLNDSSKKDQVINFEQLGIDRLFVDESHNYKNCAKRCRTR